MNIAIDVRPLMGGNISGVETYIRQLLRHLLKNHPENHYILFLNGARKESGLLREFKGEKVSIAHTRYPNKLMNLLLIFLRRPKLDRLVEKKTGIKPGAFFIPDLRPAPISRETKKVMVVHDLAYHHYPQFFSTKSRLWYALIHPKKELKESNGIIAVSKFTKRDIIKTYKIDPFKITVVHEGITGDFGENVSAKSQKAVRAKYALPNKYFLFLSTLEPRKNIPQLMKAFGIFKKKNPGSIKLVIAGKPNKQIFSRIAKPDTKEVLFPGFIDEKDKAAVYSMAEAFLYPSIFEGFGLPLLEAMKCNIPIIASHASSIPEVVGDAAILIDPDNTEEMANAMKQIIQPATRKKLQKKMQEQIKNFSWDRCAAETLIAIFLS